MPLNNTIVAIATPPGRGGIGVVRISGPDALFCARKLLLNDSFTPTPHSTYIKSFYDPASLEVIDRGVLTYFKSPRSFTGEDVVELSCHGSPILLSRIVSVVIALGIRPATAGEFTMQAVVNKRLDLIQAEAVRDLINAHSRAASTQALRQMNGELSSYLQPIQDSLLKTIVLLESSLEFVEEDLPEIVVDNTKQQILAVIARVEQLASTFDIGKFIKNGYKVALVGRPNVGKSSIFNTLLAYDRAIVTSIPGTTRDSVSEYINISGVPVLLTDTAGVHTSEDEVEKLGIERTHRIVADADLVLIILDGSSELTAEDYSIASLCSTSKSLIVVNKLDMLISPLHGESFQLNSPKPIYVSAKTCEGFNSLRAAIGNLLNADYNRFDSDFLITNERHHDLLKCTINDLNFSLNLLNDDVSEEFTLIGLHNALRYLGEITGETTSDAILGEIFSTFCIGK